MKLLTEFPEDAYFCYGTIIVIKDSEMTPAGVFDKKYALINNVGKNFGMLDLYRSMGSLILHDLAPNMIETRNMFTVDKKVSMIGVNSTLNYSILRKAKKNGFQS